MSITKREVASVTSVKEPFLVHISILQTVYRGPHMDTEVLRQKFQELRSNVVANTVSESQLRS